MIRTNILNVEPGDIVYDRGERVGQVIDVVRKEHGVNLYYDMPPLMWFVGESLSVTIIPWRNPS